MPQKTITTAECVDFHCTKELQKTLAVTVGTFANVLK